MSRERKAYPKEFKLMSVELSNNRPDRTALAKELDIHRYYCIAGGRSFHPNKVVVFLEMGR
jgi:hypothetical protein